MIYTNINDVEITREEFNNLQRFFDIDFWDYNYEKDEYTQQELIDELGARCDDTYPLFTFKFENGDKITYDLCSGGANYYDNVCLEYNNGEDELWFDCDYSLEETMEYTYGENTYICKLTIKENK